VRVAAERIRREEAPELRVVVAGAERVEGRRVELPAREAVVHARTLLHELAPEGRLDERSRSVPSVRTVSTVEPW
jgi:hypothetical protein